MGGRLEGGYCCEEGGCGGAWLVAQGGGGAALDPALATKDDTMFHFTAVLVLYTR